MSPYIQQSTSVETPSIFGVKDRSYMEYVPPEDFDPERHELAQLTAKQIEEAHEEHPDEYDADGTYIGGLMGDQEFVEARWQDAVAEVTDAEGDAERLQQLADLELSREPGPRDSVLDALADAGVPLPAREGDEGGDTEGDEE